VLDHSKSEMKKGIKTYFKYVLLCQHICNETSIQFTSFFDCVKVRVSGGKIRTIQQCFVSYNPMVLPEDHFLQQLCQTHERNPVWRDMGRLEQLEKTDGMCGLKAHRCTVGFDAEHCCANLPKKSKSAKERMCQRRSLRNKIETTISMKTYQFSCVSNGSSGVAALIFAIPFLEFSTTTCCASAYATGCWDSLNFANNATILLCQNTLLEQVGYLFTFSSVILCRNVHLFVGFPVRLLM
jgi:hypothetical protein